MDCKEEILSYIRSGEVREHYRETRMYEVAGISGFVDVLHFAPMDIHKKLKLLKQYQRELTGKHGDLSKLNKTIAMYQWAIKNISESTPDSWFCLKPYSAGTDHAYKGIKFLTFDLAMNYVIGNAKECYTIEKYCSYDYDGNEESEKVIEYVVFPTGEIAFFQYIDYEWFGCFPTFPLMCGDVVEIDATPYAPVQKCVLLSWESYVYVTKDGNLKIVNMSRYNHIAWYRMKRYVGELSGDEQILSKISRYLIERKKKPDNNTLSETVTDEFGTVFSKDMTKLIKGSRIPKRYTIPKTVKEICGSAYEFPEADNMEIIIPEGIEVIGNFAFCCSSHGVDLPESITTLGSSCFCTGFRIGKNVSEIAEGVSMYDDPISVDPENKHFTVYDDALYSKDQKRLLHVFTHKKVYKVPKSVKRIDDMAFAGNDTIKKIYIPSSVECFGDNFLPETDEIEIIFEN